jgi:hypothetical protein
MRRDSYSWPKAVGVDKEVPNITCQKNQINNFHLLHAEDRNCEANKRGCERAKKYKPSFAENELGTQLQIPVD